MIPRQLIEGLKKRFPYLNEGEILETAKHIEPLFVEVLEAIKTDKSPEEIKSRIDEIHAWFQEWFDPPRSK